MIVIHVIQAATAWLATKVTFEYSTTKPYAVFVLKGTFKTILNSVLVVQPIAWIVFQLITALNARIILTYTTVSVTVSVLQKLTKMICPRHAETVLMTANIVPATETALAAIHWNTDYSLPLLHVVWLRTNTLIITLLCALLVLLLALFVLLRPSVFPVLADFYWFMETNVWILVLRGTFMTDLRNANLAHWTAILVMP